MGRDLLPAGEGNSIAVATSDPVLRSSSTRWIEAGVPSVVLAPMEGVTDAAMRGLFSEIGGFTFCVTEFLRVSQFVPGPRAFRTHTPEIAYQCRTQAGLPVQVQ